MIEQTNISHEEAFVASPQDELQSVFGLPTWQSPWQPAVHVSFMLFVIHLTILYVRICVLFILNLKTFSLKMLFLDASTIIFHKKSQKN